MNFSNHFDQIPSIDEVYSAANRINGKAVRTPLIESHILNELLDARVLIKAETLQRTGSFKFRGAYNKISQLSKDRLSAGIIAYSSGNHAQGIAAAAQIYNTKATIIMPSDAPITKLERTKAYGGSVILYDRHSQDRESIAQTMTVSESATLIPPFNDPDIISGQGTIGLELIEQASEIDAILDTVLVPCGGGGLVSGILIALAKAVPKIPIYAVEPEGFHSMARSLDKGKPTGNIDNARSICDALQPPCPSNLTLAICQKHLSGSLSVSDVSVLRAMKVAFQDLKLVVEPGGCVALAAALDNLIAIKGRTVGVICSGGNVDYKVLIKALNG